VGKIEFSMQNHILIHMISTLFNIAYVEKNNAATWKQAPNQSLTAKFNVVLKPSCGS
jgi:hypothetical protein